MNLRKKKELAAKVLKVGKGRIIFNQKSLPQIKEAITKQDIRSLHEQEIITIKQVTGRRKIKKRKTKRGYGKIKKMVQNRKEIYIKITRKLRRYIMGLRDNGTIDRELYKNLRKKIRMRDFKSKSHLREYLKQHEVQLDTSKPTLSKKITEISKKKPAKEKITQIKEKKL